MTVSVDVALEPMAPAHLDGVLAIEVAVQGSSWSRHAFEAELAAPGRRYLVAVAAGELVGFAGAMRVEDEVHVTTVAVAPDWRRRGVGSQLVVALLVAEREGGATAATLEVRTGNDVARAMYRRLGFAPVGARRRYYADTGEDAIIMWLHDLDRVELRDARG